MFGEAEDFFYRIQYQERGAGHTHTLLCIKYVPVIGKSTEEEVTATYKRLQREMPDPDTSPTLHELVSRFQVHCCNSYCTELWTVSSEHLSFLFFVSSLLFFFVWFHAADYTGYSSAFGCM